MQPNEFEKSLYDYFLASRANLDPVMFLSVGKFRIEMMMALVLGVIIFEIIALISLTNQFLSVAAKSLLGIDSMFMLLLVLGLFYFTFKTIKFAINLPERTRKGNLDKQL